MMPLFSHLFTDHELVGEMECLEEILADVRGKSKEYAHDALASSFHESRIKNIKRLIRSDVYVNSVHFRDYLKNMFLPAAGNGRICADNISYMLRMDFSCDRCDPMTVRGEMPVQDFVIEEDIGHVVRGSGFAQDHLYCDDHGRQRDIAVSTAFNMRDVRDEGSDQGIYCLKAGVKSGESLQFKIASRLMSWMPIWDFYRARAVMKGPGTSKAAKSPKNYAGILDTIENFMSIHNPDRERFNRRIKYRLVPRWMDDLDRGKMMKILAENYFVPFADHRLVAKDGKIVPFSGKPEYREEQLFDHYHVPIEVKLTSLFFETKHSEGELKHSEYERRKAIRARDEWEDCQRGVFAFFDRTRFFNRTPTLL